MDYAADRIQGTREYQQDEFGFIDGDDLTANGEPLKVFVVADGMGGHNSGEEASAAAVRGFVHHFAAADGPVSDRLRDTLHAANMALHETIAAQPELRGMGTTLVAAALTPSTLQWISVGDSKLRVFKAADDKLLKVNADHSMAPVIEALRNDEQSAEGIRANELRSALLGEDIPLVDVSSQPLTLDHGDVVLLASDGLDVLDEAEIKNILAAGASKPAAELVQQLLQAVEQKAEPDQDNATALIVIPGKTQAAVTSGTGPGAPTSLLSYGKIGLLIAGFFLMLTGFWLFTSSNHSPAEPDIPPAGALELEKTAPEAEMPDVTEDPEVTDNAPQDNAPQDNAPQDNAPQDNAPENEQEKVKEEVIEEAKEVERPDENSGEDASE